MGGVAKKFIGALLVMGATCLVVNASEVENISTKTEAINTVRFALESSKKLDKFAIDFAQHFYLDMDGKGVNRYATEVGGSYMILPSLQAGIDYQFTTIKKEITEYRNRVTVYGVYTHKFGNFKLSLRERLLVNLRSERATPKFTPSDQWTLRSRIKGSYSGLGRFEPYALFELFNTLNRPKYVSSNYISRMRYQAGTMITLTKRHSLELYFCLDKVMGRKVSSSDTGDIITVNSTRNNTTIIGCYYWIKF